MAFKCPHCGDTARRASCHPTSERMQKAFYQCNNLACGHTFMSMEEIVCTTLPSDNPNPDVHIPISPAKQVTPEQIDIFD